uniref:Endoglucanase n=1 Tax=Eubacterium cellulosolvens (strain ATCC 43171 / JCM 9499 / 6) TaxID=633697 RepID=I5AU53_EUBC6
MRQWQGYRNGINLGGWLSQCDICDRKHLDSFIQEADIQQIAKMGFDHVRIPIDYRLFETEDGNPKEDGFRYLDRLLEWCNSYGLHMLIDVRETYGYTYDPEKREVERMRFFYSAEMQHRFQRLWMRVAGRYAQYFGTVAFELLDEVVPEEVSEAWNETVRDVLTVIRQVAPRSWVVIGGVRYSCVKTVALLDVPFDEHIVYSFHCFEPFAFTHQKAYWFGRMPFDYQMGYPDSIERYREKSSVFPYEVAGMIYDPFGGNMGPHYFEQLFQTAVRNADADHVPLYCGAYGVIDRAPSEDALRWFRDISDVFERYRIGRALWNYKGKDFGLVSGALSEAGDELAEILGK